MDEERRIVLMRIADGECDQHDAEDIVRRGGLSAEDAAYVAGLVMERTLLKAAFPVERSDDAALRSTLDRAFAVRRQARASWRIGVPLAASILAAAVVGGGTILLAEHRAEQTAARLLATFADDQKLRLAAFAEALDRSISGQSVAWRNPASGSTGTVTPLRTFQAADGRWCREYRQELELAGGRRRVTGVACRDAGGWLPIAPMES
jgi:surface antigen